MQLSASAPNETLPAFLPAVTISTARGADHPSSNAVHTSRTLAGRLLDLQTLAGLTELGDAPFFARVLQLYQRQAPAALASLNQPIADEDPKTIASAACSLKSMSLNIGARDLAHRANAIEVGARRDNLLPEVGTVDALEVMFVDTLTALDEYGRRLDQAPWSSPCEQCPWVA